MLNADMNALLENSAIDEFVDTDTNGGLGDVEDDTRASVISLVRHSFVNGRVCEDVDIVADLDIHEVLRKVDRTMLPVLLGEHVARTRSDAIRVGHVFERL